MIMEKLDKYFECGIRYEKTQEDGSQRKVTELYIVQACSFTEAEARFTNEMSAYISGESEVVTEKIHQLFRSRAVSKHGGRQVVQGEA